jgi:hypothetical protein
MICVREVPSSILNCGVISVLRGLYQALQANGGEFPSNSYFQILNHFKSSYIYGGEISWLSQEKGNVMQWYSAIVPGKLRFSARLLGIRQVHFLYNEICFNYA